MRILQFLCILLVTLFYSCKNKPTNEEVKRCLLKDFICGENARLNSFKIINSSKVDYLGIKGYEFYVDGEIEWPVTCQTGIGKILGGTKQRFNNNKVFLRKMDSGWGCSDNN